MAATEEPGYVKAVRAAYLANGYPPILRSEILSRPDLVDTSTIETDGVIAIGKNLVSIAGSVLFPAVQTAYDQVSVVTVKSIDGAEWNVSFAASSEIPTVAIECGTHRAVVPQFALLNPDSDARVAAFQFIADKQGLRGERLSRWFELLRMRVPTGDDLTAIIDDLIHTPHAVNDAIGQSLRGGGLSLEQMVPHREDYYRQLVGNVSTAGDLNKYIADVATPHLSDLLATRQPQALGLCWLLCSHSSISVIIDQAFDHGNTVLAESIASLIETGDTISRVGAIEVGLRRLAAQPELAPLLEALLSTFADGDLDSASSGFELIPALFGAIYGYMAKRRILAHWPPYARRLAALAQAAMVSRHFPDANAERAGLVIWLDGVEQDHWMLQALIDMRAEPRWFPELNSANQWKHELLGRVLNAARSMPELGGPTLGDFLNDDNAKSIMRDIDHLLMLIPGPLEGGIDPPVKLSAEDEAYVAEQLGTAVDTTAFRVLINMSMIFGLPAVLAEHAADAIERQHYQLRETDDLPLYTCLLRLAATAAASRSERLANAVLSVVRASNYLRRGQFSIGEMFHIGLVASASHAELMAWATAVGEFVAELALHDLTRDEATTLRSHLSTMCHLEPYLWRTCGRAHAALDLVIGG